MNISKTLNEVRYANFMINAYVTELFECSKKIGKFKSLEDLSKSEVIKKLISHEAEYQKKLDLEYLGYQKKREKAKVIISKLDNYKYRAVLYNRYINCLKWEEIAVKMQIGYKDILEIHGKALVFLNNKIKEENTNEIMDKVIKNKGVLIVKETSVTNHKGETRVSPIVEEQAN